MKKKSQKTTPVLFFLLKPFMALFAIPFLFLFYCRGHHYPEFDTYIFQVICLAHTYMYQFIKASITVHAFWSLHK